MLYVTLQKLMGAAAQNLLFGNLRIIKQQRHGILKLITKTISAARLIIGGTRQHAAGQYLIWQPGVDQMIERGIRRIDLHAR